MELLSGHKSGDGMVLLSDHREIERDNLWAIRGLLALVFVNATLNATSSGPGWAIGLLVALTLIYWGSLRVFSHTASEQDGDASVEATV